VKYFACAKCEGSFLLCKKHKKVLNLFIQLYLMEISERSEEIFLNFALCTLHFALKNAYGVFSRWLFAKGKKHHYIYFLFFFMPKKRRRMGARSPGERIITIFITSSQNHFSRKKPAVSSAAASTKARARPGRRNDKNTPAPNASASAPTVLHNLLVHLISASRKLYC
jgi:hypothetical protein